MKGYMTYGRAEGKFGGESPCLPGVRHVDKLDKKLKKGKTQKGKCKRHSHGCDKVGIPVPRAKGYSEEKGRLQPDKGMSGLSGHKVARAE